MDWFTELLLRLSDAVYLMLNGFAGRSRTVDLLVGLTIENDLVKAGPVCAAFFFAWFHARNEAALLRARRILIVTLGSLVLVLGASKSLADNIFLPRPFIHSQDIYLLEDGHLAQAPRLAYNTPSAGFSSGRYERLRDGEIEDNDLSTFPSDHAAFFFALALGIAMASRAAGAVALGWTLIVIMGGRIVTGTHSPLDIVAGMALGGAILVAVQLAASRWAGRLLEPAARWTAAAPALSAGLLFIALFEAGNTLDNVRHGLRTGKAIAQGIAGL